jgi:hypothetical protein
LHESDSWILFAPDSDPRGHFARVSRAMDLYKTIQDLYAEKEKLERVIASLEELRQAGGEVSGPPRAGQRGRKSMDARERQQVSARMKQYWASRRKGAVAESTGR